MPNMKPIFDATWDETPVDVTAEANFIWSIANKLRGSYMPDKYGDEERSYPALLGASQWMISPAVTTFRDKQSIEIMICNM